MSISVGKSTDYTVYLVCRSVGHTVVSFLHVQSIMVTEIVTTITYIYPVVAHVNFSASQIHKKTYIADL